MTDDRTQPEQIPDSPSSEHPEELLASYVDGTASAEDRRVVERHLAACGTCRADVGLATRAREALRSLPELPAPGVTATVSHHLGLDADDPEVVRLIDRRARRERRFGRMWAAGAGAAAVLAGVLIYLGAVSNPGGGESAGAPAAAAPSAAGAASPGSSLTAADVDALLRGIAQGGSDSGLALPSSRTPREFASPQPAASSDAQAAVQCLRSGAGLTAADQTIEIFDAAFEHTPAYIGVFRTQGGQQITAVVVSLSGCQPLYVASQPR